MCFKCGVFDNHETLCASRALHFNLPPSQAKLVLCRIPVTDYTMAALGKAATYSTHKLDEFVENCAPEAQEDFFQLPGVKNDISLLTPVVLKDGKKYPIEPPMPMMFRALELVPLDMVRVVILGQDPTPQAGQATGLAFSVADPMSVGTVLNVLLEVALEGWNVNIFNGDLTKQANNQGVLLLNTALTVEQGQGKAGSHIKLGWWAEFSKFLIEYISARAGPSVWLLWGNEAQSFQELINSDKHYVITGGHPSALGGIGTNTFFGGRYFQCANQFLTGKGNPPIDWALADENALKPCPPPP